MQEVHRGLSVTLADAPANYGFLRTGHRDENVLIALGVNLMALDVLLLLADKRPCLIKFQALGTHTDHKAVVKFHTAKANTEGKPGNRLAVGAGKARDRALSDAFTKGGNDFDLLLAGEGIDNAPTL